MKKLLSFLLILCLLASLLTGCTIPGLENAQGALDSIRQALEDGKNDGPGSLDEIRQGMEMNYTAFSAMEYTRPDMDELESLLNAACQAAEDGDLDLTLDSIYAFYDGYDWFYTNYSLADIHYSADLTDTYWEEEYNFCMENYPQVDAALEELFYSLAASPLRETLEQEQYFGAGYFDYYDGENLWDEGFTALLEQEAQLQSRYYELSALGVDYADYGEEFYQACGNDMVDLLVELIALRQEIAAYWGYDSYVDFATDYYYYRDYSSDQTGAYLEEIKTELVPLYTQLYEDPDWWVANNYTTERRTYAYVSEMAANMGGTIQEAFQLMDKAGLYDITYSENKYASSFEVYLDMYYEPFVFMCPEGADYDKLVFAHEFGHFCNDYAAGGCYAGVDVLEIFSQSMEYLSLCYTEEGNSLTRLKLWDSLSLFVEQAAFASFEMQMYELEGEALTAENLRALYDRVAREYGFESVGYDDREFVIINHYYTSPMYIISYIVSNDTAMQLYQMELAEPGAGLACYEENLDTEAYYFLEFLEEAGLESPFAPGRIEAIRKTLEEGLK